MIRSKMHKIFLEMAISILFSGLQLGLPNVEIGQESGSSLYAKLVNIRTNHRMSLRIRQKFLLLAHCRFVLSKILGNYQVSTRALTRHTPTMQTIFVLQHISNCFLRPVQSNYPFESEHPPISLNKCCEIMTIVDNIILKRYPQLGDSIPIGRLRLGIMRLIQKCAFANIGIKIGSDAAFGIDSSYLGSINYWRELTPQMFWFWANQDGLLRRMIPRVIFVIKKSLLSQ